RLWDAQEGKEIRRFSQQASCLALSRDGRFALVGGWDHSLRLWDVETGDEVRRFEGHTRPVRAVALSPDGKLALSGGEDHSLRLWDVKTGQLLHVFAPGRPRSAAAFPAVFPPG